MLWKGPCILRGIRWFQFPSFSILKACNPSQGRQRGRQPRDRAWTCCNPQNIQAAQKGRVEEGSVCRSSRILQTHAHKAKQWFVMRESFLQGKWTDGISLTCLFRTPNANWKIKALWCLYCSVREICIAQGCNKQECRKVLTKRIIEAYDTLWSHLPACFPERKWGGYVYNCNEAWHAPSILC